MIKLIKFLFDILTPRFITEVVYDKNLDKRVLVRGFTFLGFMFFSKLVEEPE